MEGANNVSHDLYSDNQTEKNISNSTQFNFSGIQVSNFKAEFIDEKEEDNFIQNVPKKMKFREEETEIDISKFIDFLPNKIPVKNMRRLIPKMRIECYFNNVHGKKKMKHLWDNKPTDWPDDVPFKDPNNSGKEEKKPGKDELCQMFVFLRKKLKATKDNWIIENQNIYKIQDMPDEYKFSVKTLAFDDTEKINNLQLNNVNQFSGLQAGPSNSSTTISDYVYNYNNSLTDNLSSDTFQDLQQGEFVKEEEEIGRSELCFNNVKLNKINVDSPGDFINQHTKTPKVIVEMIKRIKIKMEELDKYLTKDLKENLFKLYRDVLWKLYDSCEQNDNCLLLIDAGHQMEALLDSMYVLSPENNQRLMLCGCHEIMSKFSNYTECHLMEPNINSAFKNSIFNFNNEKCDKEENVTSPFSTESNPPLYKLRKNMEHLKLDSIIVKRQFEKNVNVPKVKEITKNSNIQLENIDSNEFSYDENNKLNDIIEIIDEEKIIKNIVFESYEDEKNCNSLIEDNYIYNSYSLENSTSLSYKSNSLLYLTNNFSEMYDMQEDCTGNIFNFNKRPILSNLKDYVSNIDEKIDLNEEDYAYNNNNNNNKISDTSNLCYYSNEFDKFNNQEIDINFFESININDICDEDIEINNMCDENVGMNNNSNESANSNNKKICTQDSNFSINYREKNLSRKRISSFTMDKKFNVKKNRATIPCKQHVNDVPNIIILNKTLVKKGDFNVSELELLPTCLDKYNQDDQVL